MPIEDEIEEYEKLIQLIRNTLQHDEELRAKYGVAGKFRFIRDCLEGLLTHLEEQTKALEKAEQQTQQEDDVGKVLVYVYLYNAQGAVLRSWMTLLTPKVFYEYSINRPIYLERSNIEALIRSKRNIQQHAYLTVKINPNDIISSKNADSKDALGNSLIKIREGSLRFENLVAFTQNGQDYRVSAQGEFVKK